MRTAMAGKHSVNRPEPARAAPTSSEALALAEELVLSGKPFDYEWVLAAAARSLSIHKKSGIELGALLLVLKARTEHGQYEDAVRRLGLSPATAWRYSRRAEFLLSHPEIFQLKDLNGQKLDTLIRLPGAVLEEIVDEDGRIAGHTLHEIKHMTVPELTDVLAAGQEALQAAERQIEDLRHAVGREGKKRELAELRAEDAFQKLRQQLETTEGWPPVVHEVREESMALLTEALACLDGLEGLMSKLLDPKLTLASGDLGKAQYSAAATALYLALQALATDASYRVRLFVEHVGEEYAISRDHQLVLAGDEEVRRWRQRVELLSLAREGRQARRATGREIRGLGGPGQPERKRGRPRKHPR